jgi:hypothetical protein
MSFKESGCVSKKKHVGPERRTEVCIADNGHGLINASYQHEIVALEVVRDEFTAGTK